MDAFRFSLVLILLSIVACKSQNGRLGSDVSDVGLQARTMNGGNLKMIEVPELKGQYVAFCFADFKYCGDDIDLIPRADFLAHMKAAGAAYEKHNGPVSPEAIEQMRAKFNAKTAKLEEAIQAADPAMKQRLEVELAANRFQLEKANYETAPDAYQNTVNAMMSGLSSEYRIELDPRNSHLDQNVVHAVYEVLGKKGVGFRLIKALKVPQNQGSLRRMKSSNVQPVGVLYFKDFRYQDAPKDPYVYAEAPGTKAISLPFSLAGAVKNESSNLDVKIDYILITPAVKVVNGDTQNYQGHIAVYDNTGTYPAPDTEILKKGYLKWTNSASGYDSVGNGPLGLSYVALGAVTKAWWPLTALK